MTRIDRRATPSAGRRYMPRRMYHRPETRAIRLSDHPACSGSLLGSWWTGYIDAATDEQVSRVGQIMLMLVGWARMGPPIMTCHAVMGQENV